MDIDPIMMEMNEETAQQLLSGKGRFPPELLGKIRSTLLEGLSKEMPADERAQTAKELDELLGTLSQKPPGRFAMDMLLDLVERDRKRSEALPALVISLARMLEVGGLDAPHLFRLGGVFESVSAASAFLQSAEKNLREISTCACFPGNAAPDEKDPSP